MAKHTLKILRCEQHKIKYVWPIYNIMHERINSIFIGVMTKQYARENDIIETSEYKKLMKEVRAVFIKCAKYLLTSMSVLKNDVIKSLTLPRRPERHQEAMLDELMQRFSECS